MKTKQTIIELVKLKLFILVVIPLVNLFIIALCQYGFNHSFITWITTSSLLVAISYFILLAVELLIFAISNNIGFTGGLFTVICITFATISHIKLGYREEPFTADDLYMINNTFQLIGMLNIWIIIAIIFSAVLAISAIIYLTIKTRSMKTNRIIRTICLVYSLLIGLAIGNINNRGIVDDVLISNGDSLSYSDILGTNKLNGGILTFANSVNSKIMEEPTGYSKHAIKKIEQKYEKIAKNINSKRVTNNLSKQNVVYVLSESFSDVSKLDGVQVSGGDPLADIHNIEQNNTSGLMMSSGYGGGTANMEYQALTGFNMGLFAPTMRVAYTQLVPSQKSPSNVTELFNHSFAMHPFNNSFYLRQENYKKFGFDNAYFQKDLKHTSKIYKNPYISDSSVYSDVYEKLKSNKSGTFVNLVTMQNHMPFTDKYKNYPYKLSGKLVGNDAFSSESYVEGTHYTSVATKKFLDKVDKLKTPTTIVFYGDHLPDVYPNANINSAKKLHQTDYFIYSNAAARVANGATKNNKNYSKIVSPANFTPLLLEQLNQKVSPYYAMQTLVNQYCPSMTIVNGKQMIVDKKTDKLIDWSDLSKKQKELFDDLKMIQYDQTVGKNYSNNKKFMSDIVE